MNALLKPGLYVVAVSGGVDSMVLLDLLRRMEGVRMIVAHYDHGIRGDSAEDRRFVQRTAARHGLPFVYDEGKLGAGASEALAREARYKFLHHVRTQSGAHAIVTAHHEDDVLETALLNVQRGTRRRGLSSLRSTDIVKRPLLGHSKKRLVSYARANGLTWREDSTNSSDKYRRNHVRHNVMPKLTPLQRQHFTAHVRRMARVNDELDHILINMLHVQPSLDVLDRNFFVRLPHTVARELMHSWLKRAGIRDMTTKRLEAIVVAGKTYKRGQRISLDAERELHIDGGVLALRTR